MAGNRLSEEDQQHVQDELMRLSTLLDQTVVQLKNEFKSRDEQQAKHAEELATANRNLTSMSDHIITLQQFRSYLVTDSAKEAFDLCVGGLRYWLANHIHPVLDDKDSAQKALGIAKTNPISGSIFSRVLQDDRKLQFAAQLEDLDVNIVEAGIYSWLARVIYGTGLGPVSPDAFRVLEQMEQTLKGDPLYAQETWKAKIYHAWINTPQYKADREKYALKLATDLATGMSMFLINPGDFDAWVSSLHKGIVGPNLALKEEIMGSIQDFQLEFITDPLIEDQTVTKGKLNFQSEMFHDITSDQKILQPGKLDSTTPIRILSAYCPCFYTRLVVDGDVWTEPQIISKQERLVALKEDYEQFVSKRSAEAPGFWAQFVREIMDESPSS
ncbi:hypothetical protein PG993_009822 [Apiospora rasikravindrae]|uniref:Uncharacterized protein n=1 Tax=Apiospora rasikravindrae TaxID=990691 RepID=A0ABR1SKH5_9PEZI